MAEDKESRASEMMKRILTVGVGTVFLTEEAIRALTKDFKLPKEILSGILESAGNARREFLEKLSEDVITRITENVDPVGLAEEFLSRNKLELKVTVSLAK